MLQWNDFVGSVSFPDQDEKMSLEWNLIEEKRERTGERREKRGKNNKKREKWRERRKI